jgi:hypothetical protein
MFLSAKRNFRHPLTGNGKRAGWHRLDAARISFREEGESTIFLFGWTRR